MKQGRRGGGGVRTGSGEGTGEYMRKFCEKTTGGRKIVKEE